MVECSPKSFTHIEFKCKCFCINLQLIFQKQLQKPGSVPEETTKCIAVVVPTTEAEEAIASSDFSKSWVFPPKKVPTGVIQVSFDLFESSDFNVWLRSWNTDIKNCLCFVLRSEEKSLQNNSVDKGSKIISGYCLLYSSCDSAHTSIVKTITYFRANATGENATGNVNVANIFALFPFVFLSVN